MRLPVTGGFPCSARAVGHRLVRDYPPPRAVSRPTLSTRAPRGRCGVGWVPDRTPADRRDGDSLHDSLRRDRTPRLVPPKVGLSRKQVGNPPNGALRLPRGARKLRTVTLQRKLLLGFSLMVIPAMLVGVQAIRTNERVRIPLESPRKGGTTSMQDHSKHLRGRGTVTLRRRTQS